MARGRRRQRPSAAGGDAPPNPQSAQDAGGAGDGSGKSAQSAEDAEDGRLDFINMMPDDILSLILSFVEVRDAVRAKLLSRRWRHLYPSDASLCFDIMDDWIACRQQMNHPEKFVALVDKAMRQFRAPKIKAFTVHGHIDVRFAGSVDEWIERACKMNVEELSFFAARPPNSCVFPLHLLPTGKTSHLKHLCLVSCFVNPFSALAEPLTSLRTLVLRHVHLHKNIGNFDIIASGCPYLENLTLECCSPLPNIQHLCSQMLCLKSLCIVSRCTPADIVIHDVNLMELMFNGRVGNISFSGLNRFHRLSIHCPEWTEKKVAMLLSRLSKGAPQLKFLDMRDVPSHFFQFPTSPSPLECLNELHLGVTASRDSHLGSLLRFLECAPLLKKFSIWLYGEPRLLSTAWVKKQKVLHARERRSGESLIHAHLKEALIRREIGVFGRTDLELALNLLKTATSLEVIVLAGVELPISYEIRSVVEFLYPEVRLFFLGPGADPAHPENLTLFLVRR